MNSSILFIGVVIIFTALIVTFLVVMHMHNSKYPEGWTKVMKNGLGEFVVVEWATHYDWFAGWHPVMGGRHSELADAIEHSEKTNKELTKYRLSEILTEIEEN